MEFRSTRALRGSRLHDVADVMLKTKTYGAGRICMVDGCGTRLSAYNPSSVCALHGGAWQDDYHRTTRKATPARGDHAPLRVRAVRPRVHDDQPRQEVLQRRLPHEGLPGPRHGVAPHGRRRRRRAARQLRRRTTAPPLRRRCPGDAGRRAAPRCSLGARRAERRRDHRQPPARAGCPRPPRPSRTPAPRWAARRCRAPCAPARTGRTSSSSRRLARCAAESRTRNAMKLESMNVVRARSITRCSWW